MTKRLDPKPARTDLTDRECTKIIGGILGALCQMTDIETLRNAVKWWAETDELWGMFTALSKTPLVPPTPPVE
jgi:hypothetical protein